MPRDAMPGREIPPDLADMLTADLARAIALVDRHDRPMHTSETAGSFHH